MKSRSMSRTWSSGTVSVIDAEARSGQDHQGRHRAVRLCADPDGSRLYVANQSSEDVSVIDTQQDRVVETIEGVGTKPHGIAITADGKKVYVTQFLSERPAPGETRPLTQSEGADDGRVGRVTVIERADQSGDQHRDPEPAPRYRGVQVGREHAGTRATHHAPRVRQHHWSVS